jgi:hypothetical protein
MKDLLRCFVVLAFVALLPPDISSKRGPAKVVSAIVHDGIRYSAPNDNGRVGYVLASDANTGRELARFVIFRTKIDPVLEEDVQWVFITDLKVLGNSLVVRDEKSRCYQLNLKTKDVKKKACFLLKLPD